MIRHWARPDGRTAEGCNLRWGEGGVIGTKDLDLVTCQKCLPAVARYRLALRTRILQTIDVTGCTVDDLALRQATGEFPRDATLGIRRLDCGCCGDGVMLEWYVPAAEKEGGDEIGSRGAAEN